MVGKGRLVQIRWTLFKLAVSMGLLLTFRLSHAHQVNLKIDSKYIIAHCTLNLREIGLDCVGFADTSDGRFPNDFAELFRARVDIEAEWFMCPAVTKHGGPAGNIPSCDYIYIPGASLEKLGTTLLAFCANHGNDGRIVTYVGSFTEWLDMDSFRKALRATLEANNISLDLPPQNSPILTPELKSELERAIANLESSSAEVRTSAKDVLARAGYAAKDILLKGTKSGDTETFTVCSSLVKILNLKLSDSELAFIRLMRRELGIDVAGWADGECERGN